MTGIKLIQCLTTLIYKTQGKETKSKFCSCSHPGDNSLKSQITTKKKGATCRMKCWVEKNKKKKKKKERKSPVTSTSSFLKQAKETTTAEPGGKWDGNKTEKEER